MVINNINKKGLQGERVSVCVIEKNMDKNIFSSFFTTIVTTKNSLAKIVKWAELGLYVENLCLWMFFVPFLQYITC